MDRIKGYEAKEGEIKMLQELENLHLTGNILPPQWLHHLKLPSGKPNVNAAIILSDIVYWYRPVVVRDEYNGKVLGLRKKYAKDLLQRSYNSYAEQYGFTKRQAREAIKYLERKGLINLVFRPISVNGTIYNNVLFIELNIEKLREISEISLIVDNKGLSIDEAYPMTL